MFYICIFFFELFLTVNIFEGLNDFKTVFFSFSKLLLEKFLGIKFIFLIY